MYYLSIKAVSIRGVTLVFPTKSLFIETDKPWKFRSAPGYLVWVCCKALSKFSWHPFGIVNSNDYSRLNLFIRCYDDGWTEKLFYLIAISTSHIPFKVEKNLSNKLSGTELSKSVTDSKRNLETEIGNLSLSSSNKIFLSKTVDLLDIKDGIEFLRQIVIKDPTFFRNINEANFLETKINEFDLNIILDNKYLIPLAVKWDGLLFLKGPVGSHIEASRFVEYPVFIAIGSGCVPYFSYLRDYVDQFNFLSMADEKEGRRNTDELFESMHHKLLSRKSSHFQKQSSIIHRREFKFTLKGLQKNFTRLANRLIYHSCYYNFYIYLTVLFELITVTIMISWNINGVMKMNNGNAGKILWPILLYLMYLLILSFTMNMIAKLITFRIQIDRKEFEIYNRKKRDWSIKFLALDILCVVISLVCCIVNVGVRGAYEEHDFILQDKLNGGIISVLTWDFICYENSKGTNICELKPSWHDSIAGLCFILIIFCAIYRILRLWARFANYSASQYTLMPKWQLNKIKEKIFSRSSTKKSTKDSFLDSIKEKKELIHINRCIYFFWTTKSLTWIIANTDILFDIMKNAKILDLSLEIKIYVTGSITQDELDEIFNNTLLEGCVFSGRANFSNIFNEIYDNHKDGVNIHKEKVRVFYTGPKNVLDTVYCSFLELRNKFLSYCSSGKAGTKNCKDADTIFKLVTLQIDD